MSIKIILSDDGSHTLFVEELNETYHSIRGAIAESQYVFIQNGLEYFKAKDKLKIFEVGLGTGLNALLTLIAANQFKVKVEYHSLEAYPLHEEVTDLLNYDQLIDVQEARGVLKSLHALEWGKENRISEYFSFTKIHAQLFDFEFSSYDFDIIYYDAFAPSKQPDMWSVENFRKVTDALKPGGIIVSYCANGQFKRDLKSLGLQLDILPGPLGKKEMTRGIKPV